MPRIKVAAKGHADFSNSVFLSGFGEQPGPLLFVAPAAPATHTQPISPDPNPRKSTMRIDHSGEHWTGGRRDPSRVAHR